MGKDEYKTKELIQKYEEPYNKIECVKTSKILGHIMNTTNNLNEAVEDRIQKAKAAWRYIRNSIITNKNISKKLRLMLFDSLITSILLYSLHIIPMNKTNISKLQRFYSKCIRVIAEGNYKENCKKPITKN